MHSLLSLLLGVSFAPTVATWVVLLGDVLALATIPSVLLRRAGRPMSALSWVLALLTLPYLGVLLWWILGRTHLSRQRRRRKRVSARLCERCPEPVAVDSLPEALRATLPFAVAGRRWTEGVFPPAALTSVRVLRDGEQAFPTMEAAIEGAKREIRAYFYIWQDDATGRHFADLLAEKAKSGVHVCVMADAIGGGRFLRKHTHRLRDAGVNVARFLPARFRPWAPTFNFRNHRKLLLIDGDVGFVGGMNIGDEYRDLWHDLAYELKGPVLAHLDDVFQEDWLFAAGSELSQMEVQHDHDMRHHQGSCTIIASGPDRDENRVHDAFFLGISQARRRVWLATPYFVPDSALLAALRGASARGLDVRIILPRHNDVRIVQWASRSYYTALLRAGIRIFEYLPRFAHTKAILLDDEITMAGSPNADMRSFRLNFELACFIESRELNQQVNDILVEDMATSVEILLDDQQRRPKRQIVLESAAHLLSALL